MGNFPVTEEVRGRLTMQISKFRKKIIKQDSPQIYKKTHSFAYGILYVLFLSVVIHVIAFCFSGQRLRLAEIMLGCLGPMPRFAVAR